MMSSTNKAGQVNTRLTAHDSYCTPPRLLRALGLFDFDPCCPEGGMAYRTAAHMIHLPRNGLSSTWHGRVWLNPPYMRNIGAWLEKLAKHGNGIALVPAKGTDTRWAQSALTACDATYFMAGRLLFFRPDGTKTEGKWMPNMLLAYGKTNVVVLASRRFQKRYPGILMQESKR